MAEVTTKPMTHDEKTFRIIGWSIAVSIVVSSVAVLVSAVKEFKE